MPRRTYVILRAVCVIGKSKTYKHRQHPDAHMYITIRTSGGRSSSMDDRRDAIASFVVVVVVVAVDSWLTFRVFVGTIVRRRVMIATRIRADVPSMNTTHMQCVRTPNVWPTFGQQVTIVRCCRAVGAVAVAVVLRIERTDRHQNRTCEGFMQIRSSALIECVWIGVSEYVRSAIRHVCSVNCYSRHYLRMADWFGRCLLGAQTVRNELSVCAFANGPSRNGE